MYVCCGCKPLARLWLSCCVPVKHGHLSGAQRTEEGGDHAEGSVQREASSREQRWLLLLFLHEPASLLISSLGPLPWLTSTIFRLDNDQQTVKCIHFSHGTPGSPGTAARRLQTAAAAHASNPPGEAARRPASQAGRWRPRCIVWRGWCRRRTGSGWGNARSRRQPCEPRVRPGTHPWPGVTCSKAGFYNGCSCGSSFPHASPAFEATGG